MVYVRAFRESFLEFVVVRSAEVQLKRREVQYGSVPFQCGQAKKTWKIRVGHCWYTEVADVGFAAVLWVDSNW